MQTVRRFAFLALTCSIIGLSHSSNASADSAEPQRSLMQVVSFGDSLSDVGTYAYARQFGGGTYTTNPGAISVQVIAEHYGSDLTPALTGGFGQPSVVHPEGFGYAQGGARVAGPPNPGDATGDTGELQTPLTSQVAAYLQSHTSFTGQQLVLVQGGANDVQDAYSAWAGMVANGGDPGASLQAVLPSLRQAAQQFAGLVHNVRQHGATHIVVQNVPDISKAPIASLLEQQLPGSAKVLRRLAQVFNTALMTVTAGVSPSEAHSDREFRGRLIESAVGAHLANAAAVAECELYYWRDRGQEVDFIVKAHSRLTAIEVKSGRAPQAHSGSAAFAAAFKTKRTLLVGGDGISVEEFLSRSVSEWLAN